MDIQYNLSELAIGPLVINPNYLHCIALLVFELGYLFFFFFLPFSDLILTSQVLGYHASYRFNDCADSDEIEKIQGNYIEKLRISNYNYFCETYDGLCIEKNVEVTCLS